MQKKRNVVHHFPFVVYQHCSSTAVRTAKCAVRTAQNNHMARHSAFDLAFIRCILVNPLEKHKNAVCVLFDLVFIRYILVKSAGLNFLTKSYKSAVS